MSGRHSLGSGVQRVETDLEILVRAFRRPHVEDVMRALLGRHQVHDPRSRNYEAPRQPVPTQTVVHNRHAPIWDQGRIGCCTTNAGLGALMTEPFYRAGRVFAEPDCQNVYARETQLNAQFGITGGPWPPNDSGSCFLALAQTLQTMGLVSSYQHTFSTQAALGALGTSPICAGIPWYDSMFNPNAKGVVEISPNASVVGGHEIEISAIYPAQRMVGFPQSWGTGWGVNGWGFMSWDTLDRLLHEGGDVGVFVL